MEKKEIASNSIFLAKLTLYCPLSTWSRCILWHSGNQPQTPALPLLLPWPSQCGTKDLEPCTCHISYPLHCQELEILLSDIFGWSFPVSRVCAEEWVCKNQVRTHLSFARDHQMSSYLMQGRILPAVCKSSHNLPNPPPPTHTHLWLCSIMGLGLQFLPSQHTLGAHQCPPYLAVSSLAIPPPSRQSLCSFFLLIQLKTYLIRAAPSDLPLRGLHKVMESVHYQRNCTAFIFFFFAPT